MTLIWGTEPQLHAYCEWIQKMNIFSLISQFKMSNRKQILFVSLVKLGQLSNFSIISPMNYISEREKLYYFF